MPEKDVERGPDAPPPPPDHANTATPKSRSYDDPSSKLWSLYLTEAAAFDKAMVEGWKSDMDGILIFSGLFSAVVTAFIIEGYKGLQEDSGDVTVMLLSQISQQLAGASNGSRVDAFSPPTDFQPSTSGLIVNLFWFISLTLSVACALAAILVQQWSRNYMQAIERRPAPHIKARIRSYLYEGVEKFRMTAIVEGIPTLLHGAVFLFLIGLVDFLFPINQTIAITLLGMVSAIAILYGIITVLPVIHRQSPFSTPLSGILWRLLQAFRLLRYSQGFIEIDTLRFTSMKVFMGIMTSHMDGYCLFVGSMTQGRETLATIDSQFGRERDTRALCWTAGSLTEDSELVPFIEAIAALPLDQSQTISRMHTVVHEVLQYNDCEVLYHILHILWTCSRLEERQRVTCTVSCINALAYSFQNIHLWRNSLPDELSRLTEYLFLQYSKDKSSTIVSAVNAGCHTIWAGVISSAKADPIRWMQSSKSLAIFLSNARAHSVIMQTVPGMTEEFESCMENSLQVSAYKFIINEIHTICIPRFFSHYSGGLASEYSQNITCLKAIYSTVSHFKCQEKNSESWDATGKGLVILIKHDMPVIAQYANATAACLTYHLQCDIINNCNLDSTDNLNLCNHIQTMVGLSQFSHGFAGSQQSHIKTTDDEISLRISYWTPLTNFVHRGDQQLAPYLNLMSEIERETFERFQLVTTEGISQMDITLSSKVVLSQAHISLLIGFLKTLQPSLQEEALEVTLDTLMKVTKDLTARFSYHNDQTQLVEHIGRIIQILQEKLQLEDPVDSSSNTQNYHLEQPLWNLDISTDVENFWRQYMLRHRKEHKHFENPDDMRPHGLILMIIQILLGIMATIGEPDSIESAKLVAQSVIMNPALQSVHQYAENTLEQLNNVNPFLFTLWPPMNSEDHLGESL